MWAWGLKEVGLKSTEGLEKSDILRKRDICRFTSWKIELT